MTPLPYPGQTLEQTIRALQGSIRTLEEGLPYADHGAYGQDKARIRRLKADLARARALQHLHAANPHDDR